MKIIKETIGEARDFHKGYLTNYLDWVRDEGHITAGSSSVMAEYFIDKIESAVELFIQHPNEMYGSVFNFYRGSILISKKI